MSTRVQHPLAADYLDRLRRAARRLPRDRREELVADIEAHLAETVEPDAGDAEALTVLDRLGAPENIVEAEQPRPDPAADPRGLREWAAVFLLPFGVFIGGVGWLIGVILLWSSRAWSTGDKWLGTLVLPGGLFAAWFYAGMEATEPAGSGVGAIAPLAILVALPLLTAVHLARRAGRARGGGS
jgi:hypothetical protein